MISTRFLLCFIIFISLTQAVYAGDTPGAAVVSYDEETFVEGLKRNRNFVMFYAPWCGHCKNLSPTWEELGRIYNSAEKSPVIISKVDCTVYTDLCALHNILGFPTLKLFSDGGTQSVRYKGRRDLESLKKFIQRKSVDIEVDAAEKEGNDVNQKVNPAGVDKARIDPVILTSENFAEVIGEGHFFIDFFAPWCGHCKQLAPVWEHLAETFNSDNKVTIAKVDCTENAGLCKQYEITGYPTLLWFKNGQRVDKYKGQRTYDALKKYVLAQISEDKVDRVEGQPSASLKTGNDVNQKVNPAGVDKARIDPVILTSENFADVIGEGYFFIDFFAPWCGHCKQLAPVWEHLAETFNSDNKVTIAKVDCTENAGICKQYEITGYPTLLWFKHGQKVYEYKGQRTYEALKKYVSAQISEDKVDRVEGQPSASLKTIKVVKLTDQTFGSHITSNNLVFVKFFVPWCGHCKKLVPVWEELAEIFHDQPVSIAEIDCTQSEDICKKYQVNGYPTLKLFHNGEFLKNYKSFRSVEYMKTFLMKIMQELQRDEL